MKQITKINEAVGMKNNFTMDGGGKRLVRPFKRQEFWKYIGCVLSEVNYSKKRYKLWSEIPKASCRMKPTTKNVLNRVHSIYVNHIGLHGFDYILFEEEEGGGTRKVLGRYPYLKHLIQLWPGNWVKQMAKMNEGWYEIFFTMDG